MHQMSMHAENVWSSEHQLDYLPRSGDKIIMVSGIRGRRGKGGKGGGFTVLTSSAKAGDISPRICGAPQFIWYDVIDSKYRPAEKGTWNKALGHL